MLNFFRSNALLKGEIERLKKRSNYLLPLISLALFALAFVLVFLPKLGELNSLKRILDQESASGKILDQKIKELSSIDLSGKKNDLNSLTYLLPDEEDLTSVILGITRLSQGEGLNVTDLKIDLKEKFSDQVKFNVEVRGSFLAIQSLVSKLNQTKRMYVPAKLELRSLGTDQGYIASLSLFAPFSPLPKNLGEISIPVREYTQEEKELIEKINSFPVYIDSQDQSNDLPPQTKSNPFE